jgi:hypothetical protein
MNRAPLPALRLNLNVPAKLEDIINRAMEKIATFVTNTLRICVRSCND